ncbi:MAG: hypothetical protein APU95_00910 [Hadesarchaea archaeon YNP_N21]|jgi:proteasome lid subunit RPN8/RPN11|nr:MAG: hypothetical protein APU95_00910 [Hadesarchaea archaeon YNP_N21]
MSGTKPSNKHAETFISPANKNKNGVSLRLVIKGHDLRAIDEHAIESFPLECVGLMMGSLSEGEFKIEHIEKGKNIKGSSTLFEADPVFVLNAIKNAEERGLDLVGIYHSHPNAGAFISIVDAEFMRLWQSVVWLVLGVRKGAVTERRAFLMKGDRIEEIEIKIG